LHIGARDPDVGQKSYWAGKIDEPAIFNRALSSAEIQSVYAAGSEGMATLVVNTTSDAVDPSDGVLSLREAITASNASVGDRDVIGFNLPGSGVRTISVATALPTITDPVVIDAIRSREQSQ
jgi:CSLREA domain-containing protein